MKTLLFVLFSALSTSIVAQVEIDKKIELIGSGTNAKIEGIQIVEEDFDAANKKYVDDQIAASSGGSGHVMGELYGGGVVYAVYKDANGNEHGLIVDRTDKSSGRSWSATSAAVPGGATSLWNGFANSEAIKAQNNNSAGAY